MIEVRQVPMLLGLVLVLAALQGCGQSSSEAPGVEPGSGPSDPGSADMSPTAPGTADPNSGDPNSGDPNSAAIDEATLARLEALGYAATAPAANPDARGVTETASGAWQGLNLYTSRRRPTAHLVDMEGEVKHTWQAEEGEQQGRQWMHVEPGEEGALFAITKDHDLAKHAWDSSLIWRTEIRAHHDLAIHESGDIYVLVRSKRRVERAGRSLRVLCDSITVLSESGAIKRTIDLWPLMLEHMAERRFSQIWQRREDPTRETLRPGGVGDVLHTNSIAFLTKSIEGIAPAGSVLLSFRAISKVAILNAELSEVLFIWGEGLEGQHDATQLPDGNILLFDNGSRRGSTRALELDPRAPRVTWEYKSDDFFSRLRGGAQALPNGNVLLTESDKGHVFEVTREGQQVWEFWNPDVRGRGESAERGVVYRFNRFPTSDYAGLLDP